MDIFLWEEIKKYMKISQYGNRQIVKILRIQNLHKIRTGPIEQTCSGKCGYR